MVLQYDVWQRRWLEGDNTARGRWICASPFEKEGIGSVDGVGAFGVSDRRLVVEYLALSKDQFEFLGRTTAYTLA